MKKLIVHPLALAVSAALAMPALPTEAANLDLNWSGPDSGSWSTAGNWSPRTVPGNADSARMYGPFVGPAARTLRYEQSAGATIKLVDLNITGVGADASLIQAQDVLNTQALSLDGFGGGRGLLSIGGGAELTADTLEIGAAGTGSLIQDAGKLTSSGIRIGGLAGSQGDLQLRGGALAVQAGNLIVGEGGTGTVTQSGGTAAIDDAVLLGKASGTRGTYSMSAGQLTDSYAYIGEAGTGRFTQTGGEHTTAKTLIIQTQSGSTGTYEISAGKLAAQLLINDGTLSSNGGNQATIDAQRLINEAPGIIRVENGSLNLGGEVLNYGQVIGNNATITLNDFVLGNTGYVSAGTGNTIILSGDILSAPATAFQDTSGGNASSGGRDGTTLGWNVTGANLVIGTTGQANTVHQIRLPSIATNQGAVIEGLQGKFAFGSLSIGEGQTLNLPDFSRALYVSKIQLGETIPTPGDRLTKLTGNSNVYYDPNAAGNGYLGGWGYRFASGSGQLLPIVVQTQNNWIGASGSFADAANWSRSKAPGTGEAISVASASSPLTVTYSNPADSAVPNGILRGEITINGAGADAKFVHASDDLNTIGLKLSGSGDGTGVYELSGGKLVLQLPATSGYGSLQEIIGDTGSGRFTQSGGTHIVNGALLVGNQTGSNGRYDLSGGSVTVNGTMSVGSNQGASGNLRLTGGTLNATELTVGSAGNAVVNQTGGVATVTSNLNLSSSGGEGASYQLSGDAEAVRLTVNTAYIGKFGSNSTGSAGNMVQSGGTHTVNNSLLIGYSGAQGNYSLTDGKLTVSGNEFLGTAGSNGRGRFSQTGGTHRVNGSLRVGDSAGSTGVFNLTDGSLQAASEIIGSSGSGSFEQAGGTHTVTGTLTVGSGFSSNGEFRLSGGKLITNAATIASSGTGSFVHSGGSHAVTGALQVGTSNGSGSYTLSGADSLLTAASERIGGSFSNGSFTQENGENRITSTSGLAIGNRGTYKLLGGDLNLTTGGLSNDGKFEITGGRLTSAGSLTSSNDWEQQGGTVSVNGSVIVDDGLFNLRAGTVTTPTLSTFGGAEVLVTGDGLLTAATISNEATLEQTGGTITTAVINNEGTFVYRSGSLTAPAINNSGELIVGRDDGGVQFQAGGSETLANTGTVRVASTGSDTTTVTFNGSASNRTADSAWIVEAGNQAIFAKPFKNEGAFIIGDADSPSAFSGSRSTATFRDDVSVTTNGYLFGNTGDRFILEGNASNLSEASSQWNTVASAIEFSGGKQHQLYGAGQDLGSTVEGLVDNFGWGELKLNADDELLFTGTYSSARAIYVQRLLIPSQMLDDSTNTILSILRARTPDPSPGVSIYYDPTLPENAYLKGETWSMKGNGGSIQPLTLDETGNFALWSGYLNGNWHADRNWVLQKAPTDGDIVRLRSPNLGGENTVTFNSVTSAIALAGLDIQGDRVDMAFEQRAGTISIDELTLTGLNDAVASYRLIDDGEGADLDVSRTAWVGLAGFGSFKQTAGTTNHVETLLIGVDGGNGRYEIDGGDLTAGFLRVASDDGDAPSVGRFDQSGGKVSVEGLTVVGETGEGTYSLTGGEHETGGLIVGKIDDSTGRFVMEGSASSTTLKVGGNEIIGEFGHGEFNQQGGTHVIDGNLQVGDIGNSGSAGSGTFSLSGDSVLTVKQNESIGGLGTATFSQFGGTHTVSGANGLTIGEGGTLYLYDGVLEASNLTNNDGNLYQYGGQLKVNGLASIEGDFYAYSNASFGNLKVGSSGFINGSGTFTVAGNFENASTRLSPFSGQWDTQSASLVFTANATHTLQLVQADTGSNTNALRNLSWNRLALGDGATLDLNAASSGKALYVRELEGIVVSTGQSFTASNLRGDSNIYYDPSNSTSLYLNGETYTFASGSGQLIPLPFSLPNEWTASGDGNWTTAGNWARNHTPRNVEIVTVASNGTAKIVNYDLIPGNTSSTLDSVTLNANGADLKVTQNLADSKLLTNSLTLQGSGAGTASYELQAGSLSANDSIVVGTSGTAKVVQSGGTVTAGTLSVAPSFGATGSYSLSGETSELTVEGSERVGVDGGIASFTQSGGKQIIGGNLSVAEATFNHDSTATYTLSGGTLTVASSARLGTGIFFYGRKGTATFEQTGGKLAVGNTLQLGDGSLGTAVYKLSGASSELQADIIRINNQSSLIQTEGTISMLDGGRLTVSSGGSYQLSGGSLKVEDFSNDAGTVTQTAGSVQANDFSNYDFGEGNANPEGAKYTLSGGSLTVTDELQNGGTVTVTGGSLSAGRLVNYGLFSVTNVNPVFTGELFNDGQYRTQTANTQAGSLFTGANAVIQSAAGDQFVVAGNFESASIQATAWNTRQASLILNDATNAQATHILKLNAVDFGPTIRGLTNNYAWNSLAIGSGQSLQLTGGSNNAFYVRSLTGAITGDGGKLTNLSGDYNIYYDPTATDNNYLDGKSYGFVTGSGRLMPLTSAGTSLWNAAAAGTAVFNEASNWALSQIPENGSSILLHSPTPGVAQTSVYANNNTNQRFAALDVQGNGAEMKLEQTKDTLNTKSVTVGGTSSGSGVYSLSGGTLKTAQVTVGNSGVFNYAGGTLTPESRNLNLTVRQGGELRLSGTGVREIKGFVVNEGTVTVTETQVNYTGTFVNNGAYISDPSTQNFQNLNIGQSGYLKGEAGDQFIVAGDFNNYSQQPSSWDTGKATLVIDTADHSAAEHTVALAGVDKGAIPEGYISNFAWGEFILGKNQSMTLVDGNGSQKPALYSHVFTLGDGVGQLQKVASNYNVYYDPDQAQNAYLGNIAQAFGQGTGLLIPANATPSGVLPEQPRGLTVNELGFGHALDGACQQVESGDLHSRCVQMALLSDNQKTDAIRNLTPDQTPSQTVIPLKFTSSRMDAPLGRLDALRHGTATPFQLSFNGRNVAVGGTKLARAGMFTGGAAGDPAPAGEEPFRDNPIGAFIQAKFSAGDKSGDSYSRGLETENRAVTAGVDYRFNDKLVAGVAMNYTSNSTRFNGGAGRMESNSLMGAVYGSVYLPYDFYVDGMATYGNHDYSLNRQFRFPGFVGQANSNPNADQVGFAFTLGKDFNYNGWMMTPYARFEYSTLHIDQYRERGGRGLDMKVRGQTDKSFIAVTGAQVSKAISTPVGVVTPAVRVEWEHQFLNDSRRINMRLADAPVGTGDFTFQTGKPDRDYVNLGGSVAATLPGGGSLYVRYDSRLGQSTINQHTVELGVRFSF